MRHLANVLLALAPLLLHSTAVAQTWKPGSIWVTGTDDAVWIVAAGRMRDQPLPVVQMWHAPRDDKSSGLPRLRLPSVTGDPVCVAADREALRILYSDLGAMDYTPRRGGAAGPLWKAVCRSRPLAWGGDPSGRAFWAIVRTADLLEAKPETPASRRAEKLAGEEPRKTPPHAEARADIGAAGCTLLVMRNGAWHRQCAGPVASGAADRFWVAPRKDRVTLLWSDDGHVLASAYENGAWSSPTQVVSGDVRVGWAGSAADGAVFVAGLPADSGAVHLRLFVERSGGWTLTGDARDGNELLAIDPKSCGVGIARGQLAIARPTRSGGIEFGQTSIDSAPAVRFNALSMQRQDPAARTRLEDMVTLVLLLGVVTFTLASRRQEANQPILLPPTLALAAVWRRFLATLLDLAPAMIVTTPWWWPTFASAMNQLEWDGSYEQMAELDAQFRLPRLASILLYGGWCYAWELAIGTSPGKLLFGCRVLSLDGSPPSARQCFLRNLSRVFMVAMGSSGFLATFMTMVLLTRNRQRIGDLLARTIVVEPAANPRPPPRDEGLFGPFE